MPACSETARVRRMASRRSPRPIPCLPAPAVHGQPGEHHDRDRVPGQAFLRTRRGGDVVHAPGREAVVTDHRTGLVRHDEGARRTRLLVPQGVAAQPPIEDFDTAVECLDTMSG